jgi:hypothetical protein
MGKSETTLTVPPVVAPPPVVQLARARLATMSRDRTEKVRLDIFSPPEKIVG